MTDHRFVMLKPMKPGVSGYARIQSEAGETDVLISARGLRVRSVRVFWYGGGGEALELADARVNTRGEATLSARWPARRLAPERLQALLIASDDPAPAPLMIGLCVPQSAGSLLDAKNALLALCERLARERRRSEERAREELIDMPREVPPQAATQDAPLVALSQNAPQQSASSDALLQGAAPVALSQNASRQHAPSDIPSTQSVPPEAPPAPDKKSAPWARAVRVKPRALEPTREIFLTAIDPLPYVQAVEDGYTRKEKEADTAGEPPQPPRLEKNLSKPPTVQPRTRSDRPPADRLPRLGWSSAFESLRPYFDRLMPCAPFDMPGWRFVQPREGLYIGRQAQDGRVTRVAYAFRGDAPPDGERPYQPMRGADGATYQVLWQNAVTAQ